MSRALCAVAVILGAALAGAGGPVWAAEAAGADPGERVSVASLLAGPDRYEGKEIIVIGGILGTTHAVFPNGRPYYTLTVGEGSARVTVFAWEKPTIGPGERVEVTGTFYAWRFNLRLVIESHRIVHVGRPN